VLTVTAHADTVRPQVPDGNAAQREIVSGLDTAEFSKVHNSTTDVYHDICLSPSGVFLGLRVCAGGSSYCVPEWPALQLRKFCHRWDRSANMFRRILSKGRQIRWLVGEQAFLDLYCVPSFSTSQAGGPRLRDRSRMSCQGRASESMKAFCTAYHEKRTVHCYWHDRSLELRRNTTNPRLHLLALFIAASAYLGVISHL